MSERSKYFNKLISAGVTEAELLMDEVTSLTVMVELLVEKLKDLHPSIDDRVDRMIVGNLIEAADEAIRYHKDIF